MQRNMFPGCNSGGMGSMGINPLMFCGGMQAHHTHAASLSHHPPHPSHHHHPHHHQHHHLHHHPASQLHPPPSTLAHHHAQLHAHVPAVQAPPVEAVPAAACKGKKRKSSSSPARPPRPEKKTCTAGILEHMKDTNLVVLSDDHILIMKAKYPKALHHYIVVPRENLASLKNAEARHLALFRHMDERARNYIASQNLQVSFRYGYHAIPITDQLVYLHAISQDFDSPWLRTKKQWNSFNTEYFIESTAVLQCLASRGRMVTCSAADGKRLLEMPISCHKCSHPASSMMELKQHLLKHLFTGPLMPDVAKSVHPLWPTVPSTGPKKKEGGPVISKAAKRR
ncbi:aprataxin isoform X2 [Hyalella azteca]|uniref:Aprataxin isoform X2 n=1 Tax=Hyalella azteca TaxID=294128 RepID=A0A8B7NUA3_HYAAZ|nr:aprataxin isoform X2 [Hyalella azteca]